MPAPRARAWGRWRAQRGVAPFDALLDVVVADGLRTGSGRPSPRARRTGSCGRRSGRTRGRSSAAPTPGAHLDTMCGAIYSTSMLGDGVRARGLLSWEQAVRLLTDVPARLYGLRDRGRLEVGGFADVVVFDPATIGHGAVRTRDDLPGGASRLYADAVGVRHVLVNGTEIVARGGVHRRRARTACCARAVTPTPCTPARTGRACRPEAPTSHCRPGWVRAAASRAPSRGSSHPPG